MHRFQRITALLLTLSLLLSLAACGGSTPSEGTAAATSAAQDAYVYRAVFSDLPEELENLSGIVWYSGRFYAISYIYDAQAEASSNAAVSFLPDGSDVKSVPLSLGDRTSASAFWPLSDGGGWVLAESYPDTPGDDYTGPEYTLLRVDGTGAETQRIDLSFAAGDADYAYIESFLADAQGHILFTCDDRLHVLDADGSRLFDLYSSWGASLSLTADGVPVLACYNEQGKYSVRTIDIAARAFGKTYSAAGTDLQIILAGDAEYELYAIDSDVLCGFGADSESPEKIFSFLDLDILSDRVGAIAKTGGDSFTAFVYDENGSTQLCTISPAPAGQEKTTLTLACLYADSELKESVIAFNRSSTEYRINLVDYSVYDTDEDSDAGLTKLSTEITSGQVPDILELSHLPYSTYAAKGLLLDLGERLDSDPDLTRSDFLDGALRAMSVNGGLYGLAQNMQISCLLSLRSIVGDKSILTPHELLELLQAHPGASLIPDNTAQTVLYMLSMFMLDDFINTETGTCSFDSDEFRELLEIAALSPAELDYDNYEYVEPLQLLTEGSVLFNIMNLYDTVDLQYSSKVLGDELAIVGYPTGTGTGVVAQLDTMLGISASSPNADAAWAFIKSLYAGDGSGEGYSGYFLIPTLKSGLEAMLREAATPSTYTDENGETIEYPKMSMSMGDGPMIEIYAASEEEIALFRSIVDSVDRSYSYDSTLMSIIMEESAAFFAGQKTAAEVSSVIQSRVQIYISETRG